MPTTGTDEAYRYDAFISYRHVEPDRTWAKWLHRTLETYRVPKRLAASRGLTDRLRPIFRDEEELPAAAELKSEIDRALRESRFLIVICSPRIVASHWCNLEIERFRELGRHDRILALLIEGEPTEAFPPALREIRRTVTDARGLTREEIELTEPLAADIRPNAGESHGHLMRMAKLRLLAQLLGVRFDDLRQRELERRQRRMMTVAAVAGVMLVLFAGLASVAWWQRGVAKANETVAKAETSRANQQAELATANAENERIQRRGAQQTLLRLYQEQGRQALVRGARSEALTPLLEGYALAGSLDGASTPLRLMLARALAPLEGAGPTLTGHTAKVNSIRFSPGGERLLTSSEDCTARVWDAATGRLISTINNAYHGGPDTDVAVDQKFASAVQLAKSGQGSTVTVVAVLDGSNRKIRLDPTKSPPGTQSRRGPAIDPAGPTPVIAMFAAISRNGKFVATCGSTDVPARIWDAVTGEPVVDLAGSAYPDRLEFVADDTKVLDRRFNSAVVWDALTGQELATMAGPAKSTPEFELSADGRRMVMLLPEGSASLWDLSTGGRIGDLHEAGPVQAARFSPDSAWLVTAAPPAKTGANPSSFARLWNSATGKQTATLLGAAPGLSEMIAVSADGKTFAVGGGKGLLVWRGRLEGQVKPDVEVTLPLAFGPSVQLTDDGSVAAIASQNGVNLVDTRSGTLLRQVTREPVAVCAFASGGRRLFAGFAGLKSGLVQAWDWTNLHDDIRFTAAAHNFSPQVAEHVGRRFATAGGDQTAAVWETTTGRLIARTPRHPAQIWSVSIRADERQLVTACQDGKVRWWDAETGKLQAEQNTNDGLIQGGLFYVTALYSPAGDLTAAGGSDGMIRLYHAGTDGAVKVISRFKAHTGAVTLVRFDPAGGILLSVGEDRAQRLWSVPEGEPLAVLGAKDAELTDCRFFPHDRRLVTVCSTGEASIWPVPISPRPTTLPGSVLALSKKQDDAADEPAPTKGVPVLTPAVTLMKQSNALTAVAVSPDEQHVTATSADGTAVLWDARTGRQTAVMRKPQIASAQAGASFDPSFTVSSDAPNAMTAVAFSSDGGLLATAGRDRTVTLWDAASGACLFALTGHAQAVTALRFAPDDAGLLSISDDGAVSCWDLRLEVRPSAELTAILRRTPAAAAAPATSPSN